MGSAGCRRVTMRPPRSRPDAAGRAQHLVILMSGGQRAAQLPSSCSATSPSPPPGRVGSALRYGAGGSHSDHPAPAPMLSVGCSQRLPVAGGGPCAAWLPTSASSPPLQCGPRSALRGSRCDRSAPTTIWWAVQSARPAADRAQLGCPHPPRARLPRCRSPEYIFFPSIFLFLGYAPPVY